MSTNYSSYPLKNLHTGEFEEARLYHAITQNHVDSVERAWKPILQKHLSDLKKKHHFGTSKCNKAMLFDELGALMIQDADWDWGNKHNLLSASFGYLSCAIECNGEIQGLGYFDISQAHKSRIITTKPTPIAYVEFIACAPWNRAEISQQLYSGVGIALITHAIDVSMNEGMNGCIGLHSLPQAEKFYAKKCRMNDFGIDKAKNMKYFEMSDENVANWLADIQ